MSRRARQALDGVASFMAGVGLALALVATRWLVGVG